jgi:hypothetical protein
MLYTTTATFGEVGYQLGDFTPYSRFEYTHFSGADPFFVSSGLPTAGVQLLSAGVKYSASASVAVKLEAGADLEDSHRHLLAQAAFAF